jgi:hypothetical protein
VATLSFYEKEPVLRKKQNGRRSEGKTEGEEERRSKRSELASVIVFLLEFMAVSAVFLAIWYYIGEFYQGAIFFFAKLILLAMGYTLAQISAVNLSGAYLGNFNLVPLVALAIATPRLAMRRRCEMLAIGIPLLFFLHVLDLVAHFPMYFYGSGLARMVVYSIGVAGVAAPFIIWFCIGYRDLFEPLIKKGEGERYFHKSGAWEGGF